MSVDFRSGDEVGESLVAFIFRLSGYKPTRTAAATLQRDRDASYQE